MNIYIGEPVEYNDMQWPCPDGFHVPTAEDWSWVDDIMGILGLSSWNNWRINLHMPLAGGWDYSASRTNQGTYGSYWSSTSPYSSNKPYWAVYYYIGTSWSADYYWTNHSNAYSIRAFKDSFEKPNSSWTVIKWTLGSAWIFWNQVDWLISITDGSNRKYTMMDKNLWATTVYNNWDTLTQDNMWNMYQRWNNYWFPSTWTLSKTSSTQVNASTYWPWTTNWYYESDTFIKNSTDWSSVTNNNLRWWVSQWTSTKSVEVKNIYIGEYGWKPWSNTVAYYPLTSETTVNDMSGNNRNLTNNNISFWTFNWVDCAYNSTSWRYLSKDLWFKISDNNFTINMWIYKTWWEYAGYAFFWWLESNNKSIGIWLNSTWDFFFAFWYDDLLTSSIYSYNTRYNLICTYNTSTKAQKIYVNGQLSAERTATTWIDLGNTTITLFDSNALNTMYGGISNTIIESTDWTLSQVQDYYSQTKSNYWL